MWEGQWIPLVIFFLTFIPPVFVGYFKGWKTALMTTLVLLALSGIAVGIGAATYSSLIWPLFKQIFIKPSLDSGMNADALKDISKATAISIWAGVLTIPNYFITFLIYFPFRERLEKHLWPITSDVDVNTKTITHRRQLRSRVIGVSITFVSSVFTASVITNAATAFFGKTKSKFEGMSNFTGALSDMYLFGQSGYDDEYYSTREFLDKDFKNAQMNLFKNLMYIPQSGDVDTAAINNLSNEPFKSKLKEIMQKPRTSEALANLILRSINLPKINLLDNDYNGATPTNFNDIIQSKDIHNVISRIHLGLNIAPESKAKMLSEISNSIFKSFEQSGYSRELNDVNKAIADIQAEIVKRQKASVAAKNLANEKAQETQRLIAENATLGARITALGDDTTGLIGIEKTALDNANTDYTTKNNAFISASSDFDSAKQQLNTKEAELKSLQDQKKSKEDEKARNTRTINDNNSSISANNASITRKTADRTSINNQLTWIDITSLPAAQTELNDARALSPPNPEAVQAAQDKVTRLTQERAQKQNQVNALQAEIDGMTNDNATKTQENTRLANENTRLDSEISTLDGQIASKQSEINSYKASDYNPKKQVFDAAKAANDAAEAVKVAAQARYDALQREVSEKTAKIQANQTKITDDAQIILNKSNEWNTLNNKMQITGPVSVFTEGAANTSSVPIVGSILEKQNELEQKKTDPAHGQAFLQQQKKTKFAEWLEIKEKYMKLISELLSV